MIFSSYILLVLSLLSVNLTFAGDDNELQCPCNVPSGQLCCYPGTMCHFTYMGTEPQCKCWMNTDAWGMKYSSIRWTFSPKSRTSPGECVYCGINKYSMNETESNLNIHKMYPVIVTMYNCYCPGGPSCKMFVGSYDNCVYKCESYQNSTNIFLNNTMVVKYLPQSTTGPADCACCGQSDPCRVK